MSHQITVEDAERVINEVTVTIARSVLSSGEDKALEFDLRDRTYKVYSDRVLIKKTKDIRTAVKAYNYA